MRSGSIFLAILFSIGLVPAQQTSGPVEGFTYDPPTMSLRPVVGSIGSASLGAPLFRGISFGSVAPQQSYALIFDNGRCSIAIGLGSAQTSTVKVPGDFALPENVAWSSDGSTAVLYSRAGNWIQILSGLPSAVNAEPSLNVGPLGTLSAVAADTQGEQIVVGVTGANAGIYRVVNGSSFEQVLSLANPVALGFSEDGQTLYGIDAATSQVFSLTMATLASQFWPLTGIGDPIAIKSAHDAFNRAVIYIAGRSDHLLIAYDSSTQQVVASAPLGFEPEGIQNLGIDSFLFGSRATSDDILWAFRNTPQPAVYFVPAPPVKSRENTRK